jgi:hypothetical protein
MMEGMYRDKQDAWLTEKQDGRKVMTNCEEVTDRPELDPKMMRTVREHQEVPKEQEAVMPDRGLRKQRRDWNMGTWRRQKLKGRIQASLVSRKRLTVKGDTPCQSGMAQKEHSQKRLYQCQCGTRNLERTDIWEETSAKTGMQQEHKETRC